jgi:hypothetical protein
LTSKQSLVSKDSIAEYSRVLLNQVQFSTPPNLAKSHVIIPCTSYAVKSEYSDLSYGSSLVLEPIVIHDNLELIEFSKQLMSAVNIKALLLDNGEEMSLNTRVFVIYDDGSCKTIDLDIYDGAPGLANPSHTSLSNFEVLKTDNSVHFYLKYDRKPKFGFNSEVDSAWLSFKELGRGNIRVTHNVKSEIKRIT